MIIYTQSSGITKKPEGHSMAVSENMFSPVNGSFKTEIHLTRLQPGGGLESEEVHGASDQIFHLLEGTMEVFSGGKKFCTMHRGDALHVKAGDPHGMRNLSSEEALLYVITTPPLE